MNEAEALRRWLEHVPGPRQVVLEASGFWPAFVRARWLETVPGIGAYSAMVILGEIGDIARLATKRALASYAGLTSVVRESAGKRRRGGIGHHGSTTLRWIMLQVAQVAVARKLLTAVWALLRHGVCFEQQRFLQQA